MLQGAGLKKGDVSYIPIGTGAQAISALTSGKVSGAAFPYPELALYEAMGHVKFRFFHHPILKDIPNVAYAATPATIAAKGDILKRFVRAHVEAAIFIRENPEAAARMFVQGSGLKVTPEAIQDEINLLGFSQDQLPGVDPTNQRIGYMPLRGLNVYANFMAANGLANSVVPASAIVTNDFIAYGNDFNRRAFIARARATH
jgi:NitT/TauT family transport system substrate-binding protein